MKTTFRRNYLAVFILVWSLGNMNLSAQQNISSPEPVDIAHKYTTETLTIPKLKNLITEIENKKELDEAVRTKLLKQYRDALYQLALSQEHKKEAEKLKRYIETTPEEIKKIREQLEQLQKPNNQDKPLPPDILEYTTSKELGLRLAKEQADLLERKNKLSVIEGEIQRLQMRPDNIQKEIMEENQKLEEYTQALKASSPEDEDRLESHARITLLQAWQNSSFHEINKLKQELLSHDIKRDLLVATRDIFNIKVSYAEKLVKTLEGMVNQFREKEVQQATLDAEIAKREAIGKHPVVKELAEENSRHTTELTDVAQQISNIDPKRTSLSARLEQLNLDYENAKKQIEIAGKVDEVLVQIMLDRRRRLPDVSSKKKNHEEIRKNIISTRLRRFRLDEEIRALSNIRQEVARIMSEKVLEPLPEKSSGDDIEKEITVLLTKKNELLKKLDTSYGTLLNTLGKYHSELKQYIENIVVYAAFMDENLMWVPSSPPFSILTWHKLISSFTWLFSPNNWKELGISFMKIFTNSPVLSVITLLITSWLFSIRIKLKKKLEIVSGNIGKISSDHFKYTIFALLITMLSAIPFPLILGFVAWQLLKTEGSVEFVKAFGFGMLFVSWFILSFQFFRVVCYNKGLGETHFRWKKTTLKILRNNLFWLLIIVSITCFFSTMVEYQSNSNYRDSLGRLGFITGMAAFAVFVKRVIQPKHGIFANVISASPNGWLYRTKWLWYPAAILLPVLLAGLAALGYYYVAFQLGLKLLQTLWILFGAVICYYLGIRWFYIKERRLALEQALERRKAAAAKATTEETGETTETILPQFEEPVVNLSAVKEQTRNLLRFFIGFSVVIGIWMIWASILPALNILHNIKLWPHTVVVNGETTQQWITLFHVMLCMIVGVFTTVAAKNLPGALEIAVLQNLPIQSGSRYAITSISQYIIITIGLFSVFNFLGVNWSQFGWLFAALSVGIGFGLQEVVANFICGILLFIERPIRVGDIITVSEVSGTVSKIKIRATTITNWDRQEYVVPNKEFITGRILNWTLSNSINRITIEVGIAYGSDVKRTHELLLQIADEHPEVLKEPAPFAIFQKFGDSTLNMILRCYLPNLDKRLTTIHDIHTAIHSRFKEAGIEIAFPQRDIHIRRLQNRND